jgi:hypothetical protein
VSVAGSGRTQLAHTSLPDNFARYLSALWASIVRLAPPRPQVLAAAGDLAILVGAYVSGMLLDNREDAAARLTIWSSVLVAIWLAFALHRGAYRQSVLAIRSRVHMSLPRRRSCRAPSCTCCHWLPAGEFAYRQHRGGHCAGRAAGRLAAAAVTAGVGWRRPGRHSETSSWSGRLGRSDPGLRPGSQPDHRHAANRTPPGGTERSAPSASTTGAVLARPCCTDRTPCSPPPRQAQPRNSQTLVSLWHWPSSARCVCRLSCWHTNPAWDLALVLVVFLVSNRINAPLAPGAVAAPA